MSKKLIIKNLQKNTPKLTAEKVAAVKKSAPMKQKNNSNMGAPHKVDEDKQHIKKMIYISKAQEKIMEQNAINAGFSSSDKNKWLKTVAITPIEETTTGKTPKEIAVLREKVKSLQAQLEMKDEMIELLKGREK